MNPSKLKPALVGGVLLGILSVIPFVNFPNICCCAWAVLGGVLATYLYIGRSPDAVRVGDGALLGLFSGLIGAVIYVVLGLPISVLAGNSMMAMMVQIYNSISPELAEKMRAVAAQQMSQPVGTRLLFAIPGVLIFAALLVAFATIGGMLAVPLFEKRKGDAASMAPPPPPSFGGPTGGYGGA